MPRRKNAGSPPEKKSSPDGAAADRQHKGLGRPLWQGIGALVGIGSLVLAIALAWNDRDAQRPSEAGETGGAGRQEINGNCNGQGTGIQINCAPAPITRAALTIKFDRGFMLGALFAGKPSELPQPPPVPVSSAMFHCAEWSDWMESDPRIYRPLAYLAELSSGEQDLVAIKSVQVKIFKRSPMAETTTIICGHGGGGEYEGYTISVDTAVPSTTVYRSDSTEGRPMPPASISLGGAGFTGASISAKSLPGYLYEGQLLIESTVNGVDRTYSEGTVEDPLRWAGDTLVEQEGFSDWNFADQRFSHYADQDEFFRQIPAG